jgi:uncharacterized protein YegP (UPF0339 family)
LSTKASYAMRVELFLFIYILLMANFVISKKLNGDFKFEFTSRKGRVVFSSKGFAEQTQCLEAIQKIQHQELSFLKCKSSGNKQFFKVECNGFVVGISRKYTTDILMQKGIDEIKANYTIAETLDFSVPIAVFEDSNQ